jgi:hypothetical protein
MQTTWKATLVGVCGIVFGVGLWVCAAFVWSPPTIDLGMGASVQGSPASPAIVVALIMAGAVAIVASLWLAAKSSGEPHRLRATLRGLVAGVIASAVSVAIYRAFGVIVLVGPAIAVAFAIGAEVPGTSGRRVPAVLAAGALMALLIRLDDGVGLLAAPILIAFAIPLADAATDQYRTATR